MTADACQFVKIFRVRVKTVIDNNNMFGTKLLKIIAKVDCILIFTINRNNYCVTQTVVPFSFVLLVYNNFSFVTIFNFFL